MATDIDCSHLPDDLAAPAPSGAGCYECEQKGERNWLHLRICQECGHIGCCDNSPGKHATQHFGTTNHPVIRSFEPGEDWWYCFPEHVAFEIDGSPPAPSYR